MRIIQLRSASDGGIRRHVALAAAALTQRRHQVVVIAPPRSAAGLRQWLRRADVIHAHGLKAGALAVALTRPLRQRPAVIVTLHNRPVGRAWVRLVGQLLGRVCAAADAVLAVSSDLAAWAISCGAPACERALIPAPSLSPSGADPTDSGNGQVWAHPWVVTIARLAPQKGLEMAVAAALNLATPGVTWVIAGEGPARPDLERLIAASAAPVRLLGRRDDIPTLLHDADLVICPSLWEGQSIALQEALRAGAAIIATDVGGNAELLGDAAKIVRPAQKELSNAVDELLTSPEKRADLRHRAHLRAQQLPTAESMTDQLARVYATARPRA